jgi:TolB-like protein/Tfp pilus assembly protein PilF
LELRKAFGPSADLHLAADYATCRIQDPIVDLDQFERLCRSQERSELQMAADIYRGEFLADFHIASEPFQEWLAAERDRTLAMVCGILQRLTAKQEAANEHEAAIRSARRSVALDALSETGQRALMRAYARAGRRGEALRQYKNCTETLQRELGVTPDAETQALAAEIASSGTSERQAMRNPVHRDPAPLHAPDASLEDRGLQPSEVTGQVTVKPRWPCLLPNLAVAVVPIRNLTSDPERQYLVEAFTDDLVTDLVRHGRGLSLKPLQNERPAAGALRRITEPAAGYDYIVTGSAQRGNPGMLRVNMRIINASSSEYLWAGRHEFRAEDLADVQTKITRRISRELHVLLLQAASRRALSDSGVELGTAECLSRAASALEGELRPELSAEAQRWYLAALANEPRNVEALTGLARTCQILVSNPWWGEPRAVAAASDLGREAVALALSVATGRADARCTQGMLYSAAGQLEEAERAFDKALAMHRGLGMAHGFSGYNAAFLGRPDETLPAIERAMHLDPADRRHSIWLFFGGFAELLRGRIEMSIGLLQKSLERNPSYGSAQLFLTAALSAAGRRSEATATAARFRSQYPHYRIHAFEQLWLSRSGSATYRAQIHPLFEKIRGFGMAN